MTSFVCPLLGVRAGEDTELGFGANHEDYSSHGGLVAVVDPDKERVAQFNAELIPPGHPRVPWYPPDQFGAMIEQDRPDTVIVASPDHTHTDYILAALERGVDVITEKPMVTTAADARRVLAAERASPANVLVTHNLRYVRRHQQIKRLVRDGAVGRPTYVTLEYHVDIRHGASYFLRWNRRRALSGGLSVHKGAHHLDLVSWWLDDVPERVYAVGGRSYYGPDSPHRPRSADGTTYSGRELRARDPYFRAQVGSGAFPDDAATDRVGFLGLTYPHQYPAGREMYLYDDEIDIEDTYSSLLSYSNGASLSYTIDFSSPWEGYRLVINGTHGQLETMSGRLPDGTPLGDSSSIIYRPLFGEPETIEVQTVTGGHGGADPLMRRDIFVEPSAASRELGLAASSLEGAVAVAAGEAIWRSSAEGRVIELRELLGEELDG
ncbi:Gfo/Idh/MocA family protein [Phytoactinopolyspora limicola]|uniref:Gfo/Idh/MocA family protein n=1 Tax=Phytoactinopolyspora limicola TaxID=2715536 RepID=UPI00140E48E3|nr:Gfo/Idh/MocA family oxidoreductase [Phytoactinopolyspora limicola]